MVGSPLVLPRLLASAIYFDKEGKPTREFSRYWDEHCTLLEDAINGLISIESQVSAALNATSDVTMRLGSLEPAVAQAVADLARIITDLVVLLPPQQSSGGASTITLTGDVTGSGTTSIATTIANNAVTFAKMQAITDLRLLGASGGTAVEEISLGSGLAFSGNTLINTGTSGGAGAIYPAFTAPVDGDFAWINQGSATVTVNGNGGIRLRAPANATTSMRVRKKAAPSTPYTITACFLIDLPHFAFLKAGLCFRQSSDGKLLTMCVLRSNVITDSKFESEDMTSATVSSAANANITNAAGVGPFWLQITDNGTNRILAYSVDGYNFETLLTEGRTTFLTADEVGFFANSISASSYAACTLLSWAQT